MSTFDNIQMVILRIHLKIKPEVDSAIQEVINSTGFIRGKAVGLFEEELAQYLG